MRLALTSILTLLLPFAAMSSEAVTEPIFDEEAPDDAYHAGVRVEFFLDSNPQDTAYEIRGPLPEVHVIAHASFGTLTEANTTHDETHFLLPGNMYYFLLMDRSNNGIEDGFLRITGYHEDEKPIALLESHTDFKHGRSWTFSVPDIPLVDRNDDMEEEL